MDMRKRARLPFGYRVEKGEIVIDQVEAEMLKKYFCFYLEGKSVSSAAREAGILASYTALIHMLEREAYIGSDLYPALISKDYHALLLAELDRRRSEKKEKHESRRSTSLREKKRVRIYTDFIWAEEEIEEDSMTFNKCRTQTEIKVETESKSRTDTQTETGPEPESKPDPAVFAAMLYRRIQPAEAID